MDWSKISPLWLVNDERMMEREWVYQNNHAYTNAIGQLQQRFEQAFSSQNGHDKNANVSKFEQYAVHVQKILNKKDKKKMRKKQMTCITLHSPCSKATLQA